MAARVAKAICLMEFAKTDLPRTTKNIAALLVQHVAEAPPALAVAAILERLKEAQFVREPKMAGSSRPLRKELGSGKTRYAAPNRNDRAEILRNAVKEVFESAKAVRVNYQNLRSFDLGLTLDGQGVTTVGKAARIPVQLSSVHESEDLAKRCALVSTESLQAGNKDSVHWVFPITRQTEALVEDLHASRRMIAKYDHAGAQQQLRDGDKALLQAEHSQRDGSTPNSFPAWRRTWKPRRVLPWTAIRGRRSRKDLPAMMRPRRKSDPRTLPEA